MKLISVEKVFQIKTDNKIRFDLSNINEKIRVEKVTNSNIEDARWFNSDSQMQDFYKFLKRGYKGYYAYYDNKCVSRLWLFTDSERTFINEYFLYKLKKNEQYVTWGVTSENYRGLGLFNIISKYLLENNKDFAILGSVTPSNIISIKAHEKLGYKIHKKYLLIKIWKIRVSIQYYGGLKNFKIKLGQYV